MPEHNLIQAPELLRRLYLRLGLRQAHIAPTLNEGVQPVVILDDVRESPQARDNRYSIGEIVNGDITPSGPAFQFFNQLGSGVIARIHRIAWSVGALDNAITAVRLTKSNLLTPITNVASTKQGKNTYWLPPDPRGYSKCMITFGRHVVSGINAFDQYVISIPSANVAAVVVPAPYFMDFEDWYCSPGQGMLGGWTGPGTASSFSWSIEWSEQPDS